MKPTKMTCSELQLGDHVQLIMGDLEYMTATVYECHRNGDRRVWRPYVHTATFSTSGSQQGSTRVIPYLGIEDFVLTANTSVLLLRRGDPKE